MRVVERLEHREQGVQRQVGLTQVRAHHKDLPPWKARQALGQVDQPSRSKHNDDVVGIESQEHGRRGNRGQQVEPVDEGADEVPARRDDRTDGHGYFQLQPAWAPQSVGFEKVSQDVW